MLPGMCPPTIQPPHSFWIKMCLNPRGRSQLTTLLFETCQLESIPFQDPMVIPERRTPDQSLPFKWASNNWGRPAAINGNGGTGIPSEDNLIKRRLLETMSVFGRVPGLTSTSVPPTLPRGPVIL